MNGPLGSDRETCFELWDVESGNLADFYPSEEEALAAMRQAIVRYGDG